MIAVLKQGVFNPKAEALSVFLPVVFIILAIFEFLMFTFLRPDSTALFLVLKYLVMFDTAHFVLTPLAVLNIKDLNLWGQAWGKRTGKNFWGCTAIAFLLGIAVEVLFLKTPHQSLLFIFSFMTIRLFRNHHVLSQIKGFSFCYNALARKACTNDRDLEIIARSERRESVLFFLFITGLTMLQVVRLCSVIFAHGIFFTIANLGHLFLLMIGLILLYSAFSQKLFAGTNKDKFLLRILPFAFSGIGIVPAAAVHATHGIEYFQIMKQMSGRSSDERMAARFWIGSVILIAALLAMAIYIFGRHYFKLEFTPVPPPGISMAVFALLCFLEGLNWIHIWMDRNIFRMRNAETRSFVLPLIQGRPA